MKAACSDRAGVPILMYHKVAPVNPRSTLKGHYVPPTLFRRQMESLAQRGYRPIRLANLFHGETPSNPIVITFDDGYENFFIHALPVLVRLGFPATVFLVANGIGKTNAWDVLTGDVPERLMTLEQIRESMVAGTDFGSHTLDHVDLAAAAPDEARRQVSDSRSKLSDALGREVDTFCYPYGRHTAEVRGLVEKAGYRLACGTSKGPNLPETDRFNLRRVNVRRDTPVPILHYKIRRDLARVA